MIEKMGYAVSYIFNSKASTGILIFLNDASCDVDRPDGQPCLEAEEFGLIRNMLIAAVEERYRDAGKTFSVERPASSAQIQEKEPDMTGLNGTIHLLVLLTYT
ncbi:hypothetical protein BHM03_00055376 [Ensete ventricosum]|nr:hypothetical protein BHM03_00055376 [Ensete ventricosum]